MTASYAALGDVILAEPKALIGFAGPRVIKQTIRQDLPEGSSRALGWDTPDQPRTKSSSAGVRLSDRAFGHTGFTGTSMWLDPDRDLFIILLTNRVNEANTTLAIRRVRSRVADLVVNALTHEEL